MHDLSEDDMAVGLPSEARTLPQVSGGLSIEAWSSRQAVVGVVWPLGASTGSVFHWGGGERRQWV